MLIRRKQIPRHAAPTHVRLPMQQRMSRLVPGGTRRPLREPGAVRYAADVGIGMLGARSTDRDAAARSLEIEPGPLLGSGDCRAQRGGVCGC